MRSLDRSKIEVMFLADILRMMRMVFVLFRRCPPLFRFAITEKTYAAYPLNPPSRTVSPEPYSGQHDTFPQPAYVAFLSTCAEAG